MNNKQKLFSGITGYHFDITKSGASDDYFFELECNSDRLEYLTAYAEEYISNDMLPTDIELVALAISKMNNSDSDSDSVDFMYHLYDSLA